MIKSNIHKQIPAALLCVVMMIAGCSKEDEVDQTDGNRIAQVLGDNFNLSVMNAVMGRSNVGAALSMPGPYTLFAPSDEAFGKAGYGSALTVMSASQSLIARIGAYHLLDGKYDLNKMPFLFNQEISSKGGKLYITRWIKNNDTVITINGSRLLSSGIQASNGYVQVIDRMLEPYLHNTIADAIASETQLTLFYQAIQRAGLRQLLAEKGPFTVYAPANAAMISMGYPTVEAINDADPMTIAALVRYHIVADRRFVNDYILSTGPTAATTQGMIDNNTVTIRLIANPQQPGAYTGITLKGTGNTADVQLSRQDINTGNGVLHITDQVLRITQ
jgi:uncharacterized surface protein with fasciclin (FAS1) repeats